MLKIERLTNGLVVIVEEIPHVESAAYELLLPGGVLHDAPNRIGAALLLVELTARGAAELSSKELSDAFDQLGVRHSESSDYGRYSYRGSLVADKLEGALQLVSKMVQEPSLPEDEIDSIKSILLQDIAALADHPAQRAHVELNSLYYPEPYNRSSLGTVDGIEASNTDELRRQWERQYHPNGAVLSIAGKVNSSQVLDLCEKYFGDWSGVAEAEPVFGDLPKRRIEQIGFEGAQQQIVLSYPSARFGTEHYYAAKVATGVLSGGMFGRLFTEVREKRGLCYSVYARHSSTKHHGAVVAYAGTTPERADQTLEVMVKELKGLRGSVAEEELSRAKANLAASLIIGEESTASRAVSNAGDYWVGKRVRSLDEVHEKINSVDTRAIDSYLEQFPVTPFMLVTLGARKLDISSLGGLPE